MNVSYSRYINFLFISTQTYYLNSVHALQWNDVSHLVLFMFLFIFSFIRKIEWKTLPTNKTDVYLTDILYSY
jgi:hypothetical protein